MNIKTLLTFGLLALAAFAFVPHASAHTINVKCGGTANDMVANPQAYVYPAAFLAQFSLNSAPTYFSGIAAVPEYGVVCDNLTCQTTTANTLGNAGRTALSPIDLVTSPTITGWGNLGYHIGYYCEIWQ